MAAKVLDMVEVSWEQECDPSDPTWGIREGQLRQFVGKWNLEYESWDKLVLAHPGEIAGSGHAFEGTLDDELAVVTSVNRFKIATAVDGVRYKCEASDLARFSILLSDIYAKEKK